MKLKMLLAMLAMLSTVAVPAGIASAADENKGIEDRHPDGKEKKKVHISADAAASIRVFDVTSSVYGANGSDTADDTAAIQKALDAAGTTGGGIVYFPKGTYVTSKDLKVYSNTKLLGSQAKISKADVGDSYAVFAIQPGQSKIVFEELWIENNKSSGSIGIDFGMNSSDIDVQDNRFTGRYAQSVNINATGVKHIEVTGNHFEEVNYAVLTNHQATDVRDVRIVNNEFINIYSDAIELNHPGSTYTAGANIIIADNYLSVPAAYGSGTAGGFGIGVAGATHVSITGNIIENARYEAIHIEDEAKHISIVGNIINGVENDPDLVLNSGIYVIDGDYITVSGNSIRGANDYGIHLEYAQGTQATNTTITGNTVTASGGGIKVSGDGKADIIVSDNIATANQGHGLHVVGSPHSLKVTDNISRDNTGYGLFVDGQSKGWYISGNSLFDNGSGDIGLNATVTLPIPLRDQSRLLSGTVASSYTPWLDAFSLGKGAEGLLYVTATRDNARSVSIYKVSWNGTALTISQVANETFGTLGLDTPKMNGSKIQVHAYSPSPNGSTVQFDVQFEGLIMHK
ncbi:right-handed parallel beta-helix repeat-containing protein [Paenibacillus chartarius]|uniref:Right-handed parallel beta-helix repeat-containing protein n=1 Tax=Paenibacillus chartarius TaxID=747481 RepID=A0ABV6DHB1_9BACL